MSATAGQAQEARGLDERLGIKPGHVVQELGYDEDCDEDLRDAIAGVDGVELVDEEYDDVVDVVLLWWRDGDGDLSMRSSTRWPRWPTAVTSGCSRRRRAVTNHVEPSDIGEAAPTAGLSQTSSLSAGRDWSGTRLVAPKARR